MGLAWEGIFPKRGSRVARQSVAAHSSLVPCHARSYRHLSNGCPELSLEARAISSEDPHRSSSQELNNMAPLSAPSGITSEAKVAVSAATESLQDRDVSVIVDDQNVAIALASEIPSRVCIPGGCDTLTVPLSTLQALSSSEQISERYYVLRYRSRLVVGNGSSTDIVDGIRNAELVLVAGVPLGEHVASGKDLRCSRANPVPLPVEFYGSQLGPAASATNTACVGFDSTRETAGLCSVDVDAFAYISGELEDATVRDVLSTAVGRQVASALAYQEDQGRAACSVGFFPIQSLVHSAPLSLRMSAAEIDENENDETSIARRKKLHDAFFLPTDRPLFRRKCLRGLEPPNAGPEEPEFTDGGCNGRLTNVHEGIKGHRLGEKGVTVHTVRGRYLYCHYLQNRFNDSGWGCAYRSLQTIMSWCAYQGLCSFEDGILPTHAQIQQALVDIGDKPAAFCGTKDWIGANEVCYALEKLTGVSSKILHVSSGSEMESRSRELARHFDEQGSPVMVGGGVLAWTILGIARDARTGRAKFLILDPHYEGRDELKTIQAKGWVAWKPATIFKASAFYNLCMPLRPIVI